MHKYGKMKSYLLFFLFCYCVFCSCNRFNKHPDSCMENPGKEKLLIFVGEKIEVKEIEPDKSSDPLALPYAKFKARYKVLDVVCGQYDEKEITFIAYDHYGVPAFEQYKNVVLYVYNYKDTFYHESYLFDALYKTNDGQWASPPSWFNYNFDDSLASKIKPRIIEYEKEVSFDVKGMSRKALASSYPTPYYSIQKKRAIAMYGNYLQEVVQLKKDGALKTRGYYGKFDSANKVKVQDVTLADIRREEVLQILPVDKVELVKSAYVFFDLLRRRDSVAIRKMSFDSIICSICEEPPRWEYENNLESFDSFYVSVKRYLTFSQLELEIKNKVFDVSIRKLYPEEKSIIKRSQILHVYSVDFMIIENLDNNRIAQKNKFEFIKIDGKYMFYGMRTEIASYKQLMSHK